MSSKSVVIRLLLACNVKGQLIKQSYPWSLTSLIDSYTRREQLIDYRLVLSQCTKRLMANGMKEIMCLIFCEVLCELGYLFGVYFLEGRFLFASPKLFQEP